MDTRFWGPSGWRFLHQITFVYDPKTHIASVRNLFENLPYVLPCKFCRAHLTEHMKQIPLEPALKSKESLTKWLYDIHNKVNAKLRSQGIPTQDDPTFSSVKAFYEENLSYGCTRTFFPGWEFLFSIAETHPYSKESQSSGPLPNAPPRSPGMTHEELNEYNLLSPRERFSHSVLFWEAIGSSLPFQEWQTLWKQLEKTYHISTALKQKSSLIRALWKLRCAMEHEFDLQNTTKFGDLCSDLSYHKSNCGSSKRSQTCRRKMRPGKRTKTLKV